MVVPALALSIATALAPSTKAWEAGVATSYVRGGGFDGPGIAAHYLWAPSEYFALGPAVDAAYLSTDLRAFNHSPASYAFSSTFAGGLAQVRLPLRFVEPYAAVGAGYVAVGGRRSVNAQCGLDSGFGLLLAAGTKAAVTDHLVLGLRGSARTPAFQLACADAFGPAAFDVHILFALGSTLDYRW